MRETLYSQIARDLTESIVSGKYPVGALLPSESALCDQYGASRHTVREALRELTELGLVSRRKGVGTLVEAQLQAASYNHSLASLDDLVQLAVNNIRVIKKIEDIVADQELSKIIGCMPGTRWLHIASIRQGSHPAAPPICWTDNYVDPAYSGLRKLARKHPTVLISDLIEKQYGRRSTEVQQSITAVAVPNELAGELSAPTGSPALKIIRRYVDRVGKVFETTISIHPADRFTFSMVLKRSPRIDRSER